MHIQLKKYLSACEGDALFKTGVQHLCHGVDRTNIQATALCFHCEK